jgi:hypothetical protein
MKPERQRAWRRGRKAESLALLALRLAGYRTLPAITAPLRGRSTSSHGVGPSWLRRGQGAGGCHRGGGIPARPPAPADRPRRGGLSRLPAGASVLPLPLRRHAGDPLALAPPYQRCLAP